MPLKQDVSLRAQRRRDRDRKDLQSTARALLHVVGYCLLIGGGAYLLGLVAFLVFS